MASVKWASPAFEQLEALSERIAIEIIERVDLLSSFPEMGVSLNSRYPQLSNCRQLIIRRKHRLIYEYVASANTVYVLAVQHCRQQLPTAADLRRKRVVGSE